jgi:3-methyladenine DNA glycosylase AlkD
VQKIVPYNDGRNMSSIDQMTQRVQKTQHGFSDIRQAAAEVVAEYSRAESLRIAKSLFASDAYQARATAVFIMGDLAMRSKSTLNFLRSKVSRDADWHVQEILAKAFDRFCVDIGYEAALPTIKNWLQDEHPNVRRAVTEGLRIWTARPYFKDHPTAAIDFLSKLKDDDSEYVRRSVGNALRDISRKHKDLIRAEVKTWDVNDKRVKQTYDLASKFLK